MEGKIGNELEKALDSSLLSFYELEWESKNTGNLSLDFKSPKLISAISFCPRNDTNIIAVGDNYELFYWSNRWISLGEKVASDNFLLYDKVPKGALLWLHNLTSGKEERIFTFDGKKQVWWRFLCMLYYNNFGTKYDIKL